MIEPKWIKEGNRLINEFMGGEVRKKLYGNKQYRYKGFAFDPSYHKHGELWTCSTESREDTQKIVDVHLQFHKDWGWLMPVIEKIVRKDVATHFTINSPTTRNKHVHLFNNRGGLKRFHIEAWGVGIMDASWRAVVMYIMWSTNYKDNFPQSWGKIQGSEV